ncbi:hypothetical protein [Hyphomonas pacifica]|nr:hypothetical protein [Hyphomonas pacifica]RAN34997.1 hypothetical protein HY11_03090 [Hyphomonas pacifica]
MTDLPALDPDYLYTLTLDALDVASAALPDPVVLLRKLVAF